MQVPAQISNPVGLDAVIQDMQNYLSSSLSWLGLSFGRAYKNQDNEGNFYPEVYVSEREYLNVFASDLTDSLSFFDVENIINYSKNETAKIYDKEANVNIIFFVNLENIKGLAHRADENINVEIEQALEDYGNKYASWTIQSITRGIDNVYNNYNFNGTKIIDYEPHYIVSFNMLVKYRNKTLC